MKESLIQRLQQVFSLDYGEASYYAPMHIERIRYGNPSLTEEEAINLLLEIL